MEQEKLASPLIAVALYASCVPIVLGALSYQSYLGMAARLYVIFVPWAFYAATLRVCKRVLTVSKGWPTTVFVAP